MSNFFVRIETQVCIAASNWPVEGKDSRQPSLSLRQGQQVIILEPPSERQGALFSRARDMMLLQMPAKLLSRRNRQPCANVGEEFLEGFTEDDPDRVAWLPRSCLDNGTL